MEDDLGQGRAESGEQRTQGLVVTKLHQGWLSDVLGHSSATVEAKTYRQSDYAPTWFPDNWIFNVSRSEEKESDLNPRNVCRL